MNPLFIPMLALSIPIVAILATTWSRIQHKRMELRQREIDAMGTQTAERAAQYAAQIERLEQRVRVLERIVTDKGGDLAAEIDSLRDRPLN